MRERRFFSLNESNRSVPRFASLVAMPDTDTELFQALQAKHPQALAQLYDRYGNLMYSLAFSILGTTQEAEDLIQEIFLVLWRNCTYNPARGSFKSFLMVLVRSRAIDQVRSRQAVLRRNERSSHEALHQTSRLPLDAAVSDEISQRVKAAMAELPDNQRQALEMSYFEGLTQVEISNHLNVPLGTVKSWVRLSFNKLRHSLDDLMSE